MTVGGTREKLSMIATVTNKGQTRWMIIDEAFNSEKLIEFLKALIKDAGEKGVPDSGQSAGTSQQTRQSLGGRASRSKLSCSIYPVTAPAES
jgi:hypothetical protein